MNLNLTTQDMGISAKPTFNVKAAAPSAPYVPSSKLAFGLTDEMGGGSSWGADDGLDDI